MIEDLKNVKWNLYNYKKRKLLEWGLTHGYVSHYDDDLIKKMRNVYD